VLAENFGVTVHGPEIAVKAISFMLPISFFDCRQTKTRAILSGTPPVIFNSRFRWRLLATTNYSQITKRRLKNIHA